MKGLLLADPHLSDRPPSIRTETYADDILAKLDFTVDLARERGVDVVVWAGDVFHLKAPTRTSHALVQRVVQIGKAYKVPWFIVPGNHDLRWDRLESLDRQPLGVLFEAGAHLLNGIDKSVGPYPIFGVPWQQDWSAYLDNIPEEWEDWPGAELMVAHAPIVVPGRQMPYEVIDAEMWAQFMQEASCFFGHMHDPDGVFEVKTPLGAVVFCNEGALSRGSVHESTLKRKPAVSIYDSELGFERVEVLHRPAKEVFRLEERRIEEVQASRLDEFLSGVEHTELVGLSIESVMEEIRAMGLEPAVLQEIQECLEVASG